MKLAYRLIRSRTGYATVLTAFLIAGGCSSLAGPEDRWKQFRNAPETEEEQARHIAHLLHYAGRVPHLSEPDLRWEYIRLKPAEEVDAPSADRLKLALFLSAAPVPFRDDARAEKILHDYLQMTDGKGYGLSRDLAEFVLLFVQERVSYKNRLESQQQQHAKTMRVQRRALAREKEQRKILDEKLEALLAIEKSLTERDERNGTAP